jgi:glycosyltransferase involved in cell wall biosynthesis
VSVVLPTHDRPLRLAGAVRSVLEQDYPALELVVVDDASRDPVDGLVHRASAGDGRVRLLRLERNVGAAGARNAGLEQARGDVIAFLDDDDRWERHKLTRQVAHLGEHPGHGIVSCDYLLEEDGDRRGTLRFHGPSSFGAEHMLWVNFAGGFSMVAARRSALGDELRIDERFAAAEDWDLWLRCSRRAAVGVITEPLVRHVRHREPRLTDQRITRPAREEFAHKHGATMSAACRAFHLAHQRMEEGAGWRKRIHVLGALLSAHPSATGVLALEQLGRQVGRMRGDPGLAYRLLARAIPT